MFFYFIENKELLRFFLQNNTFEMHTKAKGCLCVLLKKAKVENDYYFSYFVHIVLPLKVMY